MLRCYRKVCRSLFVLIVDAVDQGGLQTSAVNVKICGPRKEAQMCWLMAFVFFCRSMFSKQHLYLTILIFTCVDHLYYRDRFESI